MNCDDLRTTLVAAKRQRNEALAANARADNRARARPHSDADIQALRLAVDLAALEARQAGCDIDDLVGPAVGVLDHPR